MAPRHRYFPHALALFWLLHIQLLLLLDSIAAAIVSDGGRLPAGYYLAHSLPPLLLLALTLIRPFARWLGPRLLPLLLVAMVTLPLILPPDHQDSPAGAAPRDG